MPSRFRDSSVGWCLLLGLLGLVAVFSMSSSGRAELPHVMAALTVLVPLTLFGVVLRSPWPAVGALAMLFVINATLG